MKKNVLLFCSLTFIMFLFIILTPLDVSAKSFLSVKKEMLYQCETNVYEIYVKKPQIVHLVCYMKCTDNQEYNVYIQKGLNEENEDIIYDFYFETNTKYIKSLKLSKGTYLINVTSTSLPYTVHYDLSVGDLPTTSKIKLNKKKLTLYTNSTYSNLKVSAKQKNRSVKKLSWKSSNTNIATVSKTGVIKTKNVGKCTISVKAKGGKWVKCKLTVKQLVVTRGMKNALKQAKSYLRTSLAFSKKSLTKQLKYHKYTNKQVSYAIENCNANWKKQAVKCAENYLDSEYLAFSYNELWEQLQFEGFTESQIEYAINKVW